jgi:hypothetical protein
LEYARCIESSIALFLSCGLSFSFLFGNLQVFL